MPARKTMNIYGRFVAELANCFEPSFKEAYVGLLEQDKFFEQDVVSVIKDIIFVDGEPRELSDAVFDELIARVANIIVMRAIELLVRKNELELFYTANGEFAYKLAER